MEIIKKMVLIYLVLISIGVTGVSTVIFVATLDTRKNIKNEKAWWLFIFLSLTFFLLGSSGVTFGVSSLTGKV